MTTFPTALDYEAAFRKECGNTYPLVDAFEERHGVSLNRERLQKSARVLACPIKVNPPSWQHGRVLYALVLSALRNRPEDTFTLLDIGTAKGFSALCLQWALNDSGKQGTVYSVDVRDPHERIRRNTLIELDGYKTLAETLAPWPEADAIRFECFTGQQWLMAHPERIHAAFIDGKHSYDAVTWEASLLADRQKPGDVVLFDDAQISGVYHALKEVRHYDLEYLDVKPERRYAIGIRK